MIHQHNPTDSSPHIDLTNSIVVIPQDLSGPEHRALTMLVEEVEKRARVHWPTATAWPLSPTPVIAVGTASTLRAFEAPYADELRRTQDEATAPEGYRIRALGTRAQPAVFIIGNDARGVLFGVGHLLRTLSMYQGQVTLPADFSVTTAPRYRLRGHQLGYRDKTNSYCGWDLDQWEQYIRDLVVFGANAIELIPPRSDDKSDSVHFPLPPLQMMAAMSSIADEYDVDVWIWYPALDEDYGDPATVDFALEEWAEVFHALPRLDKVFVPGGDPGRTPPQHLMDLLEKQAASLKVHHPNAAMWVAPQGFGQEWMAEFFAILNEESPRWLEGVVFGPWSHMPIDEFRRQIPEQYPIRNYPDITHSACCQYPVPDWDVAYAITEGREAINPRPADQAIIFDRSQGETIGFLTYSEGCHDDVNKCIWSALGWDSDRKLIDILREYSRYFIGERYTDDFAQGLLALERNWKGPLALNTGVYVTLQQFQEMEAAASPQDLKNWRFQQALYRAYYDAYIRSRLLYECGLEEQAMDQLRQASTKGSPVALAEAERLLDLSVNQPISSAWRTRIFQLAEALFQSVHMQLSARLYQGQEEVRGANLDGIDFPLNNRLWLKEKFTEIRGLAEEPERLAAIDRVVRWTDPGPGGFYDDLSDSSEHPHLRRGASYEEDPAFVRSAQRHFTYRKSSQPLRIAWRCFTGALNDEAFEMHYEDLDQSACYKVRIVYSELTPDVKVRLESNDGIEIHPFISRPVPPQPLEFTIPGEATQAGRLTLRWWREPGLGGSGTGCEVAEVWLMKS